MASFKEEVRMKKHIIIAAVVNLLILGTEASSFADELVWENIGRENVNLVSVLLNTDKPGTIYAGSGTGIIRSEDGGRNWRNILSTRGKNRCVNFLAFGLHDKNYLYAATGGGLFYSCNEGKSWKRVFQGRNYLENECTSVVISSTAIYLGTKAGLFVSKDNGRSWNKEKGRLGESAILAICRNRVGPEYIYVASSDGVFKAGEDNRNWERIFVGYATQDRVEAGEEDEEKSEEDKSSKIRYISCGTDNINCLYVATSTSVYKSPDNGGDWEPISSYGLLNREVKFLLSSKKGSLYAITRSGIFEYGAERWQEKSFGLAVGEVRSLAMDNQNNLYAACDKGLFRSSMAHLNYSGAGNTIEPYYKDEPDIKEVQQAAIKYAEVGQEKIKRWRKQASKKAILPKVSAGLYRDSGDLWHWETGSTTKTDDDVLRKGRDSLNWSVSLSWDLGELIWNNDQTSIDVRSRLMVELRDDILDEVTKLYFERMRVKMEINNLAVEDNKKRPEKELKLQELTASLDALTGGYFSNHSSG